ncbi:hypothetical protein [Niabella beijingensis]|uniref:hypothetical protein n=1 Tax=Niabella beijingensis TaxID=2872700 RepID=UPI001CBE8B39|nr:hypothetical protein [Niabella beijingensis]MBZ4188972.1 hypothetical protein [Niabella beijingensis]
MSLFYNLLEEQISILKQKGYEEKMINSPDREGLLFSQLHQKFSFALHQSFAEKDSIEFEIRATGFYENHKSIVCFKFNYLFNPDTIDLSLVELELLSQGMISRIPITTADDIPHSSDALELLQRNHKPHLKQRMLDNATKVGSGIKKR